MSRQSEGSHLERPRTSTVGSRSTSWGNNSAARSSEEVINRTAHLSGENSIESPSISSRFGGARRRTQTIEEQTKELVLIVDPEQIRDLDGLIGDIAFQDSQNEQYCTPLAFDNFFSRCEKKLDWLFNNEFKKGKAFKNLLIELCETEIQ